MGCLDQGMMDKMMADEDMTPEMAAGMGCLLGRMENMANMRSMMEHMGGMMSGATDDTQEDDE